MEKKLRKLKKYSPNFAASPQIHFGIIRLYKIVDVFKSKATCAQRD
jgi:hypothetical protein